MVASLIHSLTLVMLLIPRALLPLWQEPPPPVAIDLPSLLGQLLALGGFAALSAALINAGKRFGLVKDGQAPAVSLVLNLVGLVVLVALRLFRPELDISAADSVLETVAQTLISILALVAQLGVAKSANVALRGTPVIGYSHSQAQADQPADPPGPR